MPTKNRWSNRSWARARALLEQAGEDFDEATVRAELTAAGISWARSMPMIAWIWPHVDEQAVASVISATGPASRRAAWSPTNCRRCWVWPITCANVSLVRIGPADDRAPRGNRARRSGQPGKADRRLHALRPLGRRQDRKPRWPWPRRFTAANRTSSPSTCPNSREAHSVSPAERRPPAMSAMARVAG